MNKIDESEFGRLIGIWQTSGQILSGGRALELSGTDSYEYILNGQYILHKADVMMGEERSQTFEIFSLDGAGDAVKMSYFNSDGENGTMSGRLEGNLFLINGNGLKFDGDIKEDNSEIIGQWFTLNERKEWDAFINMKLEKLK